MLAGPVISVLVGRSSLARPCKTGREIYKARGENEGNKMKKEIYIQIYSEGRVIMIIVCVFQQNAIMNKVWVCDFESMTF